MAQAKQMKPEKTRKSDFKFTRDLIDGLAKQNVVLMTGIVNAPVIIAATTFKKGVVIALAFAIISFLTIVTCSFVPKKNSLYPQSNYICAGRLGLLYPDRTSFRADLSAYGRAYRHLYAAYNYKRSYLLENGKPFLS